MTRVSQALKNGTCSETASASVLERTASAGQRCPIRGPPRKRKCGNASAEELIKLISRISEMTVSPVLLWPRSQALLGNVGLEALLRVSEHPGSRASRAAFPSRAWERGGEEPIKLVSRISECCQAVSSFASSVIVALSTRDTGQFAFASPAISWNFSGAMPGTRPLSAR
jgi:hypothetical protein